MVEGLILETERLFLRRFTLQDVDALLPVLGDPQTMEFYPAPLDRNGVEGWIQKNLLRYERDGHGLWAVLLKRNGELIGDCGCILQEVEGKSHVEVGYHIRRDLWGKGYATEAARGCMDYAFHQLGAQRVISMIRPPNGRSRRVAEKNGLTCEKIISWRDYEHCIYAMTKKAAQAAERGERI